MCASRRDEIHGRNFAILRMNETIFKALKNASNHQYYSERAAADAVGYVDAIFHFIIGYY